MKPIYESENFIIWAPDRCEPNYTVEHDRDGSSYRTVARFETFEQARRYVSDRTWEDLRGVTWIPN